MELVVTRPRDVRIGPDRAVLLWHKRKWHCRVQGCERKVFTEVLPEQIAARAWITTRARRRAAESLGDHCRQVSSVAAELGVDWRIAHDAFVAYAEQVVPNAPPPVRVLGVDETRRGKAHYETDPVTTSRTWVDPFDTGLVDLSGDGGLFAQVNGRKHMGQLFAVPAAIAVQNAHILAQNQRLSATLQSGLTDRAVIDQAIGIMMSRSGIIADQANDRLRVLSQHENIKLVVVAENMVSEAVRRARARHQDEN